MAQSEHAKKAGGEWESTFEGGKAIYTEGPFPCIAEVLKTHVKSGSRVLDLGAGYGRDTLWLVGELKCSVVAVEPTENGSEQITKRCSDAGVGDKVQVLCGTTLEWPDKVDGAFDACLMDSVLSFVPAEERLATMSAIVKGLKPGGVVVIVSHPEEKDEKWVATLMKGCEGASGLTIVKDDERHPYQMEMDGETHNGNWSVTIATKA